MVTVYTRSRSEQLYSMMKEFIPAGVVCKRITGLNEYLDARRFIEEVIFDCDDYAAIIDEDCFVFDFNGVFAIEALMREHYYTHAGIPDDGAIPHRHFHWTTLNPFFNVLDCAGLKARRVFDKIDKPDFVNISFEEPFADLYIHLYKIGKPLWLQCTTEDDGITTGVRDNNGNCFAFHTWYAREFENEIHNKRILDVYERAKQLRVYSSLPR